MKYFFDTEFHEYRPMGSFNTIELISIGIVAEDGREFYAVSSDFDIKAAWKNDWLRQNVLPAVIQADMSSEAQIAADIIAFVNAEPMGEDPEFYAYYADYDWVVFCWLFGRMIDLPEGFPMYCRDLQQMTVDHVERNNLFIPPTGLMTADDLKARSDYPKQENEHNALDDARWNLALYKFLQSL